MKCLQRVFHYEDDEGGRIKLRIIQRIGRNWKNTRNNLFHKFYDSRRTFEQNVNHKPSGIDANHWKWFLEYRLKDSTKEKCRKNAANRAKQRYIHTGGSKTLARKRHEEVINNSNSVLDFGLVFCSIKFFLTIIVST
ncbi:hypothetical protein AHAS_Ahas02G0159700 [Arachis hypogaea]